MIATWRLHVYVLYSENTTSEADEVEYITSHHITIRKYLDNIANLHTISQKTSYAVNSHTSQPYYRHNITV